MSDRSRKAIQQLGGPQRPPTFTAQVDAVEGETCDVSPSDGGPPVYNVRLRAVLDGQDAGVLIRPALSSEVLCAWIDRENAAVLQYSEVEQVTISIGDMLLVIDEDGIALDGEATINAGSTAVQIAADGVQVERAGQNLGQILQAILTALETLTVTCSAPGSPSSPPINLAAFTAAKTRLKQVLK